MQRCAVWLCASGPDVGGGSLFMERVWVLRDWAEVLISQRFCSSLWMKSGIGEKSKLVLCLFHKRFRVLLHADQMGGRRRPLRGQWTDGSREVGVVRSTVPGAVILSRHHECSDSLWESLVHLEYFLKNLKGKAPHSSVLA